MNGKITRLCSWRFGFCFSSPANHQLVISRALDLSRVKFKVKLSKLSCLNDLQAHGSLVWILPPALSVGHLKQMTSLPPLSAPASAKQRW